MTPMIDVVFQLLIFFICTASFQPPEESLAAAMSLPKTSGESVDPPLDPKLEELEPVVVKVFREQGQVHWRIGEAVCQTPEQFRGVVRTLARTQSQLPVILDPQPGAQVKDAVFVYDVCLLSGFTKVQFAARVR